MQFSEMCTAPPKSIAIVGGGTAGWMTACLLIKAWPTTKISLIESADIGIIGVGEGATPYLKTFFKHLDISESEWMPACDATYKVGINFEGWSGLKDYPSYFHPFFSALDKPIADMFFHNCGLKRRGASAHTLPDDFFIAAELARQKKQPHLHTNATRSLPDGVDYAYHFDSAKLGRFLKSKATAKGLQHVVDNVIDVACHPSGDIDHVVTEKSGPIQADFFIDCTGFRARLIHQTLKCEYVSYADNLLNNAAVAIQTPVQSNTQQEIQTRSVAMNNGWRWQIPLTSRQGNGYVYSNNHISACEAETELREQLDIGDNDDVQVKHLAMRIGRLQTHWHKNCLAVGLSQGFIEPLEATALMLTQLTVDKFINTVNSKNASKAARINEFNQQLNTTFDGVRDYIVAHYQLSKRDDTQYWRDNQFNNAKPSVLTTLQRAWLNGSDIEAVLTSLEPKLVYLRPSWYCIFSGMGIFPNTQGAASNAAPLSHAKHYCDEVVKEWFL
jgi:glycine/D-amino acid oxidase-like deaminating enzyme